MPKYTKKRLEASDVAAQAYGRWLDIFQYLCPGMFDEAIRHLGQHVDCPLHGGEKDFRFIKRASNGKTTTAQTGVAMCTCGPFVDGFALLQRAMGKGFYQVVCDVDAYLNGAQGARFVPPIKPAKPDPKEVQATKAKMAARIQSLWNAGKSVTVTHQRYYVERGIKPETLRHVQNLRFIPSLGYYESVAGFDHPQKIDSFPAMLGLLRDHEDNPVAVHRTWLSEDQSRKAPVSSPKKITQASAISGATIRLFDVKDSDTLGLCEGIETALAVRELAASGQWPELIHNPTLPVWACYSANNLQGFRLPGKCAKTVKRIIIFSDNDENGTGMKAAKNLQQQFSVIYPDIEVVIQQPEVLGWDWLDFLVNKKAK